MKKILVALALAAVATTANAAIAGGAHDLTPGGTLSSCQYCHAPHWSNNTFLGAPLWNRNITPDASYTFYSTTGVPTVPGLNAASQTCLSCHDGTQSIGDVFQGTDDATKAAIPVGNTNLGVVLTNDHPVSMPYVPTGTPDFIDIAAVALPLYTYTGVQYVECASCHDPHAAAVNFLRTAATAICAECHTK